MSNPMSRRFPFCIRIAKDGPIQLPPAVERIARKADVFKMIENGLELDAVSFDDEEHPTEALFVFGNDNYVTYKLDKKKP
jgi:hypothetical protein